MFDLIMVLTFIVNICSALVLIGFGVGAIFAQDDPDQMRMGVLGVTLGILLALNGILLVILTEAVKAATVVL